MRKYPDRLDADKSPERAKWVKRADRVMGFAMQNFIPEILMLFHRMVILVYKLRLSSEIMPNFKEFCSTYRGVY